jgi:type IV pilus assembly protein PilO
MALDFDDLKKLSPAMKALLIGLVCLVLGYLVFTFFLQGAIDRHSTLGAKLTDLRQQLAEKEKTVAQRDRYSKEAGEAREVFKTALLKLPNKRDIPELLASIAGAGRGAGVDFITFEPKPLERKSPETKPAAARPTAKPVAPDKFYEEIPIRVQLTGSFHNTLSFFEATARLPRIVTIEDIAMTDPQEVRGRGRILKISCTMKTYMFVDTKK